MNFCSSCGAALRLAVPEGDDRERSTCPSCEAVHYVNPRNVVGCLVEDGGRVLLCRRAIEPSRGLWTLPAGFLELDESMVAGAARETMEEALAEVEIIAPLAVLDLVHIGQVYTLFRAVLSKPGIGVGPESLEVGMFGPDELPFGELAFPVIHYALKLYLEDLAAGQQRVHQGALRWNGESARFDPANYSLERHFSLGLGGTR